MKRLQSGRAGRLAVVFVYLFSALVNSQTQNSTAKSAVAYPDTAEGLQHLLQEAVVSAKSGDQPRTTSLVKDMEIPNYEKWFHVAYPEKADVWTASYRDNLERTEQSFERLLTQIADDDGQIFTRKISDNDYQIPLQDWEIAHSPSQPVELYDATWKSTGVGSASKSIGYFAFIDGKFRRLILAGAWADAYRVGHGVSAPRALVHPDPLYTEEARKAKREGTVTLWLIVGADGLPHDIKVQTSLTPDLDQKAVEAVRKWTFQPAMKDGQPVDVQINVQMNFRLY